MPLATFALNGETKRWWRGQCLDKLGDIPNEMVNWEDFVELFRDWFFSFYVKVDA